MVTKRIRSEYMKKFKDPKWETYTKCYEEMLKYRLTRRLLEHTHNPWFWSGSDTDSDSGGRSPLPPGRNQVGAETSGRDRTQAELEECEGSRMDRGTGTVPRLALQEEEENVSAAHGKTESQKSDLKAEQHTGMYANYSTVPYDVPHCSQANSWKVPERQEYQRRSRERSRGRSREPPDSQQSLAGSKTEVIQILLRCSQN